MTNKFLNYLKKTLACGLIIVMFSPLISDIYNKIKQQLFINTKTKITQEYNITSLHNHTDCSDGHVSIEWVIKNSFNEDYSIISITDHDNENCYNTLEFFSGIASNIYNFEINKINGYTLKIIDTFDIDKDNKKDILYLLRGCEIRTKEDYDVLGICYLKKPESQQPLEKVISELEKQDSIIIAPHPATINTYGMGEENVKKYAKSFDAIELNGSLSFPCDFYYNSLKARNWGRKYNIPVVTNSDTHIKASYFNNYAILLSKEGFDEQNIKDYIKEKINKEKYKNIEIQPNSLSLYLWRLF